MGQYYKPVNTENKQWLYSHDYDAGLKLMEHSWLECDFVKTVERILMKGQIWYKSSIAWVGDYADDLDDVIDAHGQVVNEFYNLDTRTQIKPNKALIDIPKFIVNHTKKEFVDKTKVPDCEFDKEVKWRIHPLPILTCVGNGQGGGDLHEGRAQGNYDLVGRWCGDVISIEENAPEGFDELDFNLKEAW